MLTHQMPLHCELPWVEIKRSLVLDNMCAHTCGAGHKRHRTTDAMSATINDLNIACSNSSLWDRKELRHSVLQAALYVPASLLCRTA